MTVNNRSKTEQGGMMKEICQYCGTAGGLHDHRCPRDDEEAIEAFMKGAADALNGEAIPARLRTSEVAEAYMLGYSQNRGVEEVDENFLPIHLHHS